LKNEAFQNASNDYYVQDKGFIFPLIPDGPNIVIDVGCGSGRLGQRLLESGKAAEIVGIELFEPAAREAMKCYRRVHIGDVENLKLDYAQYFDIAVCGDILEHLKDPRQVVDEIHRWLKPRGLIVCSVPNVRYWRIWRDLILRGEWKYAVESIMDQTHLRFFTRRSFRRLLTDASFVIQGETEYMKRGPKQQAFNRLTFGIFREFFAYQLLFAGLKK
jgi:2-polyprenyl-3-methyl-5-hydroxy-6-metoxy-1,4-benzoquinol methylase